MKNFVKHLNEYLNEETVFGFANKEIQEEIISIVTTTGIGRSMRILIDDSDSFMNPTPYEGSGNDMSIEFHAIMSYKSKFVKPSLQFNIVCSGDKLIYSVDTKKDEIYINVDKMEVSIHDSSNQYMLDALDSNVKLKRKFILELLTDWVKDQTDYSLQV